MFLFDAHPSTYRHWRLSVDGPVATLSLDVREDGGLKDGYKLKLNSYDLGVDIELNDALQRLRFEHPSVRSVVLTSARDRIFCSGANIYMLGTSSHQWKVNFCKFTNETRNGMEDSSADGLKFLAAVNGACAGGGYEIALACDEIVMIDDRSTTVSLPEVPLLGVLPGTGGLTRLTDKRRVRRDLADVFCTTAEGVRADRARAWKLVDHIARPADFSSLVKARATALAARSDRPANAEGIILEPLERQVSDSGITYSTVDVALDRARRVATFTLEAPDKVITEIDAVMAEGCRWWPLRLARELDDAILTLRLNFPEIGLWVLKTEGSVDAVLAQDDVLLRHAKHWLVRETLGFLRRTLRRLDASARSLFAVAERGSCFGGLFYELALAADRTYMLDESEGGPDTPVIALSELNFSPLLTMSNGRSRLDTRFAGDAAQLERLRGRIGQPLGAAEALRLGLVTFAPDELDWDDELRLAVEERAALSPDALTGLEASLRFGGAETMDTKIFGRLSAWQNWIFNRPNAVGEKGALKVFGSGSKAQFDWERV